VNYERKFFFRVLSKEDEVTMRCHQARKNISLAMDGRLDPVSLRELQDHLRACPSCREWQGEQAWLLDLVGVPQALEPSPGFQAGLRRRIEDDRARPQALVPIFFRPAWLRAAVFLLFVLSALFGLFLGGRLDPAFTADDGATAALRQALNLDAFADQPVDSFGAVYERLLQGELR